MTEAYEHATLSRDWRIRQIQAVVTDPMFHGAHFTYSVEADDAGFEITVRFAPIYCHIAGPSERAGLAATALRLVRRLLERGIVEATEVRVSSDGVARHGAEVLERLFAPA